MCKFAIFEAMQDILGLSREKGDDVALTTTAGEVVVNENETIPRDILVVAIRDDTKYALWKEKAMQILAQEMRTTRDKSGLVYWSMQSKNAEVIYFAEFPRGFDVFQKFI